MVSNNVRNTVWQQLLDMSRYARYYARLASRHRRHRNGLRIFLGLSATSAFVSFIDLFAVGTADFLVALAGALILVGVIYDLVSNPGDKAAATMMISQEISHLETKYRALWERVDGGQTEDGEALEESRVITEMVSDICRP